MADLSTGANAAGDERFGSCEYNTLKNHFRSAGPCVALAGLVVGMLLSDSNDNRLHHFVSVGGSDICHEVLQAPHVICVDNQVVCVDNEVLTTAVI